MLLFWSSFMWEDISAMLHQCACMWEDTNMVWCSSFDPPLCEKTLMRCYISTHACGKILAWAVILRIMILLQAYFDKWSSCDPLSNSEPVCVCVCFFTLFHSLCVCVRMCLPLFHNLCVCVWCPISNLPKTWNKTCCVLPGFQNCCLLIILLLWSFFPNTCYDPQKLKDWLMHSWQQL
jgi:hypothetical protein